MNRSERQSRARRIRDYIFWTGTALSWAGAISLRMLGADSRQAVITALGSWTFSTVLSLYIGQRAFESELKSTHEGLSLAISDVYATDRLRVALQAIGDHRPELFRRISERHLGLLYRQLQGAVIGDFEIPEDDRLVVSLELAAGVKHTLDAISFFEDDQSTPEYHHLLTEATADPARHVIVRRLFLITPDIARSRAFEERVQRDLGSGVEVRCRWRERWIGSPELPRPAVFGIWDKEIVWIDPDGPGREVQGIRPHLIHGDIAHYQSTFDQNWNKATPPPGPSRK